MKKQVIKLPQMDILKETPQQRKERVQKSKPMSTIVSKNKKKYKRHNKHRNQEW